METVVGEKEKKELGQQEILDLQHEIRKLEEKLNEAQYTKKDVDKEGYQPSLELRGEDAEIDRLKNHSIPQIVSIVKDLKSQIELQKSNPVIQYALAKFASKMDNSREGLSP